MSLRPDERSPRERLADRALGLSDGAERQAPELAGPAGESPDEYELAAAAVWLALVPECDPLPRALRDRVENGALDILRTRPD